MCTSSAVFKKIAIEFCHGYVLKHRMTVVASVWKIVKRVLVVAAVAGKCYE